MPTATVGEITLDYERSGSGPPLLMIMGMSGTALHWGDPFLEELRKDFEVITYDHRGVGASSRLAGSVTIVQMARDAAGLLEALELDSAHVLGISMGGMIAQELALERPELVRTLALGCTFCGGEGSALSSRDVLEKLVGAMNSGDRMRAIRTGWEVNVSREVAADDAAWQRFLSIAERRPVALSVVMAQMQACVAHNTRARLAEVSIPTLVIHGAEDEMLPVENGRMIASLIPGARLEVMEGVGHLFFWERPAESAALMRAHAPVPA
jgi:pimeloyl-ACP methyl ester carboxylesterase